jgi:hypothetical protein
MSQKKKMSSKQKIKLHEEDENFLDSLKSLKALADSDGGKVLIDGLVQDILNKISLLSSNYGTMSHVEMIATCASMSEKVFMLKALVRADENYKRLYADLIDEALRE